MSKHIFDASEINAVKAVYYAHCAAVGIERNFDEEIADEDSDVVYYENGNLVIVSDPRVMVLFSEHLVENMVFYRMVATRFMAIANVVRDFIKVIMPEVKEAFGKIKAIMSSIDSMGEELRLGKCSLTELYEKLRSCEESMHSYHKTDDISELELSDIMLGLHDKHKMLRKLIDKHLRQTMNPMTKLDQITKAAKGQGSASDWPFPIDQAAETPKASE